MTEPAIFGELREQLNGARSAMAWHEHQWRQARDAEQEYLRRFMEEVDKHYATEGRGRDSSIASVGA